MMKRFRATLAALTATTVLVTGGITAAEVEAKPLYDRTKLGSFYYEKQANLNKMRNGKLVRIREIGNAAIPGARLYQYVFKTTNSHGQARLASATVARPHTAIPNANVLVYDDFINSLGVKCQPSFGLDAANRVVASGFKDFDTSYDGEIAGRNSVLMGLANLVGRFGIVMIFPDFLGLKAAYTANILGGHITLDAIKAAQQHDPLMINKSQIILSGYSGGSMVAAYAAAMTPRYAPNLNIVGLAAGGMPSDMEWMGNTLGNNRNPGFGIAIGSMIGMEREYPSSMNIYNRLNKNGRRKILMNRNACTPRLLTAFQNESMNTTFNNVVLREQKRELGVFRDNSIVNYRRAPRVPTLLWGSRNDVLTPYKYIYKTARKWCKTNRGLKIQLVDTGVPDHVANATVGSWFAVPWILGRFAGLPPTNNTC